MPPVSRLRDCFSGDLGDPSVLLLSFAFFLIFTAFNSTSNIEEVVLDSVHVGNGYFSLCIIYAVSAFANWLAPSIVALLGVKRSLISGAVPYAVFVVSFIYPTAWVLYVMSALVGVGAAVLWTAQGTYLTLASTSETMSKNAGLFWAISQCSMFLGNWMVFWEFEGKTSIDGPTRNLIFAVLTAVAVVGVICLLFLEAPRSQVSARSNGTGSDSEDKPMMTAFKKSVTLFKQREMMLLFWTFLYTGVELCFYSGVYSAAIGFTNAFGMEAKRIVGLCGIVVGAGEVIGGITFGLLGNKTGRHGRDPIVVLGFLSHTLAYYVIFLNLPEASPTGPTDAVSYISPPSVSVAMFCAFLLGFGDACFNTQIYSIIGKLYPEDPAPGFALFGFTQSAAAAISFYYSGALSLKFQLGILQVLCIVGSFSFVLVEWAALQQIGELDCQSLIRSNNEAEEAHEHSEETSARTLLSVHV